jgi:cell division septation protein DedD
MREIDDRAPNEAEPRKDAEFTLGSFALLAIFFGLILLCGVFFALGYSTGKRGAGETATMAQSAAEPLTPSDSSRPKPSASAQPAAPATAPSGVAEPATTLPANEDHNQVRAASAGAVPSTESTQAKPTVRPAVAERTADLPQPNAARVAPALGSQAQLTVQVAAVSQQQDADVLASALRRRGYAVTAHRDAADNLIHVRIGPFTAREDAEKWRQKLLSDGYNAMIQP